MREIKPNTFIFEFKDALKKSDCKSVIERFEGSKEDHYAGRIGQNLSKDLDIKKSTDLFISGKEAWKDVDKIFFSALAKSLNEFKNEFDFFKGPFKDMGYAIQRTDSGQYYHWHIDGGSHEFSYRQLVAIFYLNDVEDDHGGTTDFYHQDVKITPEAGKLILFPPFWTHKHRGAEVLCKKKYIATTWVVFA
jgi:Rps23 Pro-64 3,4-dihydroxylase Tpa1-like proline 4-hydroxylase